MNPSCVTSTIAPALASRYYLRWIGAEAGRAEAVASLAGLSLSQHDFAHVLQKEIEAGYPLPRAMRRLRNYVVVTLIERDLGGRANLAEVLDTMTAFADFAIRAHLQALHAEMCVIHGIPLGQESMVPQQLVVLGMGKLGGGELNVSSDIDLIFTYAEDGETRINAPEQRSLSNHEFFTRLGKKLIAALAEITEDGFTFRVDMALRPNGASGPLAASFNMVEEYLIVQGREWERYAWVKARAITGSEKDIAALDTIIRPFVFRRYLDFGMIEAMRHMHGQIRTEVTRQERLHPHRSNNVKLGRGGIREIEFLTQIFQLIRGGRDAALRGRSTRATLRILGEKRSLAPQIVQHLLDSYTFLRNLEHRLQYLDDAQTHTLPVNQADQLLVAQMMGFSDVATVLYTLESHRIFVAAQFDAMFGAKGPEQSDHAENTIDPTSHGTLSESEHRETIEARLTALGFGDAVAAAQRLLSTWQSPRLRALPEVSRNRMVALINAALPLIISNANAPVTPLTTLGLLLDFLEAIARRSAYLSLLTEYPYTLGRVVRMMTTSTWAAKYLTQHPLLLDELLDEKTLQSTLDYAALAIELQQQIDAAPNDTERQMDILREVHHAQQFRLLAQDVEGSLTVEHLADRLSALADVMISATVQAVWKTISNRHLDIPRFAVIAYGKLGGKELGYASDLDVIFLFEDDHPNAPLLYAKLVQRFITWMTTSTAAGLLFDIDIALRPDGASGMLVSSVAAFERYQGTSAWVWEHQALTRARFCSGDAAIGKRFDAIREAVLRTPRNTEKLKNDVVMMRQKMRAAHPVRSSFFDLKHGEGGMIDIEFIVQFLVLNHAAQYPELTANIGNIALLLLCGKHGLINPPCSLQIADAYRLFRKLQHQIRLQGIDQAQVKMDLISVEAGHVKQVWTTIFAIDLNG